MFSISLTLEDAHLTAYSKDGLVWKALFADNSGLAIEEGQPTSITLDIPGDELAAIVSLAMHPEGQFDPETTEKLYVLAERSQSNLPRNLRFIP